MLMSGNSYDIYTMDVGSNAVGAPWLVIAVVFILFIAWMIFDAKVR